MTDLDLAKIKEAAERMDLSWHQCDVTVGGSPLIIMQASAYIQMCAPHTILALIARLEAAEANLKWEQHRAGRIGTHSLECHTWGPQHYECLLRKFTESEARAEREAQTATSLINVIADIREKSGVGVLPMLEELADVIGVRASTAYNEGVEAAANVSIGSVARLPRITNTHKIAEICQFDPLQGWITKEDVIRYGSEITDGIRELKKPATGQATGEK